MRNLTQFKEAWIGFIFSTEFVAAGSQLIQKRRHPMSMKKLALGILALTFLVPLVPAASAQVVVEVGHPHHHRHCWYSHHHRHCRYR
jgi:multisubunit Na+/H+ antiporter MnhE subunit